MHLHYILYLLKGTIKLKWTIQGHYGLHVSTYWKFEKVQTKSKNWTYFSYIARPLYSTVMSNNPAYIYSLVLFYFSRCSFQRSLPLKTLYFVSLSAGLAYIWFFEDITIKKRFNNMESLSRETRYENHYPEAHIESFERFNQPVKIANCSDIIHNSYTKFNRVFKRENKDNSPGYWKNFTQDCNLFINTQGYMD